jgi:hypothetical protein
LDVTQRWEKISKHLPPLAGKEPPEIFEGDDIVEDEEEDDGYRTESDSEAQDFIRRPRGSKRGATSSSQSPPEEGAVEEEEETTSPPEGRVPPRSPMNRDPRDCTKPSWRARRSSSSPSRPCSTAGRESDMA